MEKRSTKFYRKNESDVMQQLGLKPTKNSGAGWVEKEDGQNEHLICQLKSTDAQSIRINQKDIRILEANANVTHKLPIFAIQFLNTGEVWLMAKPEDFHDISKALKGEEIKSDRFDVKEFEELEVKPSRVIKSSGNAREQFHEELNKKYDKTKYAK